MMLRVYRSTGFLSRSVLRAELIAEVETDQRAGRRGGLRRPLRWRHHRS